jgi:hypothetical protein
VWELESALARWRLRADARWASPTKTRHRLARVELQGLPTRWSRCLIATPAPHPVRARRQRVSRGLRSIPPAWRFGPVFTAICAASLPGATTYRVGHAVGAGCSRALPVAGAAQLQAFIQDPPAASFSRMKSVLFRTATRLKIDAPTQQRSLSNVEFAATH